MTEQHDSTDRPNDAAGSSESSEPPSQAASPTVVGLGSDGMITDHDDVSHAFPTIGRRTMRLNARRLAGDGGRVEMILLAFEGVTGQRDA